MRTLRELQVDNEIIAIIFKKPAPLLAHHDRGWSLMYALRIDPMVGYSFVFLM